MKQEEKELLLKDLCARLPYGVIIYRISDNSTHKFICSDIAENIDMFSHFLEYSEIDDIKLYLRPISSMTEEEKVELRKGAIAITYNYKDEIIGLQHNTFEKMNVCYDWLNSHHFDYRGLIEMGLALEAPADMYK